MRRVTPSFSPRWERMACSSVAVGYSRSAHTQRYVFPQMKWSVSNLMTEGAIMSRNSWICAAPGVPAGTFSALFK